MRILFFNEGNLGSHILGQAQLEATLRRHAGGGVETRFAGLTPQGRLARAAAMRTAAPLAERNLDLTLLRWHLTQSTRARVAIRKEVAAWHPDVIHVHSHSVALQLGGLMRTQAVALSVDVPIEAWTQMPAWARTDRAAQLELAAVRRAERRVLGRAKVVLAWTPWAGREVRKVAPAAHVEVHHPGLDLEVFRPAPRRAHEKLRVLFVGGRFAEKGGIDLIECLEGRLGHDVQLDLVTPAEVAPRDGVTVHRLGPGDAAFDDLRQQADVFCLPTLGDAAPWAVLEAMASGTPVVGADVGGIADLIGPDAGLLVPHSDQRALRTALDALLDDPARRAAAGAAARARVEEHYDALRQGPELVRLLQAAGGAA